MAKNVTAFGGFDTMVDIISRIDKDPDVKKDDDVSTKKTDDDDTDDDVAAIKDDDSDVDDVLKDKGKGTTDDDDDTADDVDDKGDDNDTHTDDDTTDMSAVEPELSSYFATSIIDKLGVSIDDKNKKFEKLDDVVDLMTDIISVNSKPEFANEEVEKYDTFVRNGGRSLKEFYDKVYKDSIDIERLDLESEKDQKLVIEHNLKNLGYKEDRIKKTLERYEDAEVLKDEAADAVESIKEFQEKKTKKLLAEQENQRIEFEKQNKAFYDNVVSYVNNLKEIRGVGVDSNTKKELIDYIFRVTPEGTTQFQKAYASDAVKNLIESAYFLHPKYGDTLLSRTSKKATDDAMKKVRDKLKASKGKKNSGSGSGLGKASPNFSSLSGLIIK